MQRPHHYFSSNLCGHGIRHDVLFWHGAELESPWPAVDPAQAARLGGRQHNLQGRRRPAARLGHHIRRRLQSHLGLLGDDLDGIWVLLVDLGVDWLLLLHPVLLDALHRLQTVPGHGEGLRIRNCPCAKIGRVVRICL
jgi:hypothetical protein